jgi:hypothetical protein
VSKDAGAGSSVSQETKTKEPNAAVSKDTQAKGTNVDVSIDTTTERNPDASASNDTKARDSQRLRVESVERREVGDMKPHPNAFVSNDTRMEGKPTPSCRSTRHEGGGFQH